MSPIGDIAASRARVLVVDDEAQNRRLLEVMLGRQGYVVTTAAGGEEALKMVEREPPDLILLDVVMPGMNGYEVTATIKNAAATKNIPIIMVSAHDDRSTKMMGLATGAEDFLAKPVDRAELCMRVRNLLRLKAYGDYHDKHSQRLEREVRASEQRYQTLLDSAGDAISVLTLDGIIREVNQRWLEITGLSREQLVGRHVRDFAPTGKEEENSEKYSNATRPEGRHTVSAEIATPDGSALMIEFSTTIIDLAGERLVLSIGREVTEQRRLEKQLRQAQKLELVGRLAAGVAHEINTPVQFISDSMHFIRDVVRDLMPLIHKYQTLRVAAQEEPSLRQIAEDVARAELDVDLDYSLQNVPQAMARALDGLGRVTTIVRSLKTFSHPDHNDMTAIDLNEAIETTLVICKHEYKMVADVHTDLNPLPPVICHPGEVNQMILNIVVNAAHAIENVVKDSGGRGVIRVRSALEGDEVVVSIADTGSGIPAEIRDQVFEPFFTTKGIGKGTGQGLAVARSVIEKHGGKLTFDSSPTTGTTFFIRLPVDRVAAQLLMGGAEAVESRLAG